MCVGGGGGGGGGGNSSLMAGSKGSTTRQVVDQYRQAVYYQAGCRPLQTGGLLPGLLPGRL